MLCPPLRLVRLGHSGSASPGDPGAPLVFALGSGWRLGEVRPWLLYVWMAFPFVLSALPLPQALGLWDGSFFAGYPLTLDTLDPAFSLPAAAWLAQGLTLALGLLLLALPARKQGV